MEDVPREPDIEAGADSIQQTLSQEEIEAGKVRKIEDVPREPDIEAAAGSIQRTLNQEEIEAREPRKNMEDVPREPDIEVVVVDSIQQALAGLPVKPGGKDNVIPFTMFHAPSFVRVIHPNYYEPTLLSIGPYHRSNPILRAMDGDKKLFLRDLLTRAQGLSLKECVKVIMPLEERARSCYESSSTIRELSSSDFVEMLLVDGCFIIELFYKVRFQNSGTMLPGSWTRSTMWTDLLKVENQIPFFVLEALFKLLLFPVFQTKFPTIMLTPRYLESENFLKLLAADGLERNTTERSFLAFRVVEPIPEVHHLLHLYSLCLTPESQEERQHDPRNSNRTLCHTLATLASPIQFLRILADIIIILIFSPHRLLRYIFMKACSCAQCRLGYILKEVCKPRYLKPNFPCVIELEDCGVEFSSREESKSLCDITFSRFRGIMQIPRLNIDRESMALFANLIAYEQHRKGQKNYMMSFAFLMDYLINSSKDVALLRERKIIVSDLEDTELTDFFNNICRGSDLAYSDYHFRELSYDVAEYCIFKLLKGRVYLKMLKRDYFSNPWALISFLAAAILLGLTITQTVFTIYPYYHPRS